MANYSERVKEAMVVKLTSLNAPSASALAEEVNISQSTLSRWVRKYATIGNEGGNSNSRGKLGSDQVNV